MKFCVEDAVSAAQGGTAGQTPPPPPTEVGYWTGFAKRKIFIFFHSENLLQKKFCQWESPSVGTEANPSSYILPAKCHCE